MTFVHDGKIVTVRAAKPLPSTRLVVGTFTPAVECLKGDLQQIGATGLFKTKPILHIQACEIRDGGLSEIEARCLLEVGVSAGAGKVEVLPVVNR